MRDGQPIGFVPEGETPELREIAQAIKEADGWIADTEEEIKSLEVQIETAQEMIEHANEHDLRQPEVSLEDLNRKLVKAKQELQEHIALRQRLAELQLNFHQLSWQKVLAEIELGRHMRSGKFGKMVD